ncbi:MAG: hypothetical protein OXN89_09930 [Bryobacterales bacterium]|nr:hypothetical protein [Bryobacterales bacterium]
MRNDLAEGLGQGGAVDTFPSAVKIRWDPDEGLCLTALPALLVDFLRQVTLFDAFVHLCRPHR